MSHIKQYYVNNMFETVKYVCCRLIKSWIKCPFLSEQMKALGLTLTTTHQPKKKKRNFLWEDVS